RHVIAEMALVWDAPIVTELAAPAPYYKAEDYHQNYFQQHPFQGYCAFVVAPKLAKFREVFAEKSKPE
ncbi:MAG: peptide-methionine (S)-S-oxide reductase, partial [Herbaspirillum sp.]|nr:peptide-methionine (S)-S-oxide reductase [Herbaspirillum sp.]